MDQMRREMQTSKRSGIRGPPGSGVRRGLASAREQVPSVLLGRVQPGAGS